MGERLGEAYQVADDISRRGGRPRDAGKPCGQDAALGRPSAALQLGLAGALARLEDLAARACAADPAVPGRSRNCAP